jgi:hypothetical protein
MTNVYAEKADSEEYYLEEKLEPEIIVDISDFQLPDDVKYEDKKPPQKTEIPDDLFEGHTENETDDTEENEDNSVE